MQLRERACVLHPGAFLPTKGGVIADTNMGDHLGATLGSQSTTRKEGGVGGHNDGSIKAVYEIL